MISQIMKGLTKPLGIKIFRSLSAGIMTGIAYSSADVIVKNAGWEFAKDMKERFILKHLLDAIDNSLTTEMAMKLDKMEWNNRLRKLFENPAAREKSGETRKFGQHDFYLYGSMTNIRLTIILEQSGEFLNVYDDNKIYAIAKNGVSLVQALSVAHFQRPLLTGSLAQKLNLNAAYHPRLVTVANFVYNKDTKVYDVYRHKDVIVILGYEESTDSPPKTIPQHFESFVFPRHEENSPEEMVRLAEQEPTALELRYQEWTRFYNWFLIDSTLKQPVFSI